MRAIEEVHVLARCLAHRNLPEARKLLAASRGSAEEAAARRALLPFRETLCPVGASIRLDPLLFRGALAEMVYETDYRVEPAMAPAGEPGSGGASAGARLQWTNATPPDGGAAGVRVARCYVGANAIAAHRLLQTKPGSREELKGFRSLAPDLLGCLPSTGMTTLNTLLLRASLADALYQHVRNASASAGPNQE